MITKSLTEKELAISLRLSLPKLRADRQRGIGIPYVKHGKSVWYNLDDIYQYMKENTYPKKENVWAVEIKTMEYPRIHL